MSLPRYPEYKDSGVEWLGEVPAHWDIRRLGVYGSFVAGSGFPHEHQGKSTGDYPFYKVSDTNRKGNDIYLLGAENYVNTKTAKLLGARIAPRGGIMFPKVGAALLGNKRRILTCDSITDNNTLVFYPSIGDSKYWYFWLSILDFGQISNPGPVPSVNESQLREFPSIAPPAEEQATIAAFLDHETARIDALIEEQKRLIKLLKEKRQAVISHAVTKGLDPDVLMKDSGVEWLGKVPAHWGHGKVRYFAKLESGHTPSRGKPEYWDNCTVPWFTLADVWQIRSGLIKYVYETKEKVSELGLANSSARLLPAGTVILSRTASVGYSAILGEPMATTQDFANWICGNKLKREYLLSAFQAMKSEFSRLMMGSTHKTIYMPDIAELHVAIPPKEEQSEIVAYLDQETARIDALVDEAQSVIKLLQERRSALISAAVTGKIDVRGWQPPLGSPSPTEATAREAA